VSVEKEVLFADRARYFPWRPRLWMAAYDIMLYSAAAQALMLAWALLSPMTAGTQPVIWCKRGAAGGRALRCLRAGDRACTGIISLAAALLPSLPLAAPKAPPTTHPACSRHCRRRGQHCEAEPAEPGAQGRARRPPG
jgi:hypothetical protein